MGTGRNMKTFLQGKGTVGTCMLSERSAKNMRDNLLPNSNKLYEVISM
jgi:hypothetical protein